MERFWFRGNRIGVPTRGYIAELRRNGSGLCGAASHGTSFLPWEYSSRRSSACTTRPSHSPHADVYKEAARAGAALAQAIEHAGDELGQLARDLDPREPVSSRREHLTEQVRTLALHVARLRAGNATTPSPDLTGEIRAVMREIDYRVEAKQEARQMFDSLKDRRG